MELSNKLYTSENTEDQIEINSVFFHSLVLKTFSDYFKENVKLNKTILNSALKDLPENVLKVFKKIVYYQKIEKEDLSIEEFVILYNFFDYICADTKVIYDILREKEYLPLLIEKEDLIVEYTLRKLDYFPLNLFRYKENFLGLILDSVKTEYLDDIKTDNLYLQGRIAYFKKDFEEARSLYKKNWEENKYAGSLHNLAYMIQHGEGGYKNQEEARSLYKKNWEKNKYAGSLHNLAYMIEEGEGGYKNQEEARSLYKKNWEENKHAVSLYNLAQMIKYGEGGYQNQEEARSLYKKNWEENKHAVSLYNLAQMIKYGEGVYKNLEEARSLYKKNWEENRCADSLNNLAYMIKHGEGGYQNTEEARSLYKKNWEENKHAVSLYNLASMIQRGEGGYQNREEADTLFAIHKTLKL